MSSPNALRPEEEVSAESPMSLRDRIGWRSVAGLLVGVAMLAFLVRFVLGVDAATLIAELTAANGWLLLAALGAFVVAFALRPLRWHSLLAHAGAEIPYGTTTSIFLRAWAINCLVPAKLGDVWRAVQGAKATGLRLGAVVGGIVAERAFDLVALALLVSLGGILSAGSTPESVRGPLMLVAAGIGVGTLSGLLVLHFAGHAVLSRILPGRFAGRLLEYFEYFAEAIFSLRPRRVLTLGATTAAIWGAEALRVALVMSAMGVAGGDTIGLLPTAAFVAVVAALLTAVPLSPGGLGLTEAGMVGVLVALLGLDPATAAAVALLDRIVSTFSVLVFAAIDQLVSLARARLARRAARGKACECECSGLATPR